VFVYVSNSYGSPDLAAGEQPCTSVLDDSVQDDGFSAEQTNKFMSTAAPGPIVPEKGSFQ